MTEEKVDLGLLEPIFGEFAAQKGALIPVLQRAQGIYGYLPADVLQSISERMGVPLSQVYGVTTFYSQFYLTRRGRHIVRECDGTACHVRGAAKIIRAVEKELGITAGETTPDYRVTYEVVYCLGSCGLSPVAQVDGEVVGRLVPEKMLEIVRALD
ncbi:MAG: NAD(P)H-dependent oxidoreductase subunit E [Anaerolineales bacterium]|nr:MAG: NAD(P)H-dependent oxidoreductase subunit E [Anaerolineales bacterium]